MPCYEKSSSPVSTVGKTVYASKEQCDEACRDGACCEGAICTVKPQCMCADAGGVFKGVGTTCFTNTCENPLP